MEGGKARGTDGLKAEVCFWDATGEWKNGEFPYFCLFIPLVGVAVASDHQRGSLKMV